MAVNAYSSQEADLTTWTTRLTEAIAMMSGMDDRNFVNEVELESVRALRRGVYAKRDLTPGTEIGNDDIMLAIPVLEDQITANMWSKLEHKAVSAQVDALDKLTSHNVRNHQAQRAVA